MDTIKELTYKKRGEDVYYPPLKYYETDEKTLVAIYQGFRGGNPELDFIVKYKEEGGRLRTPSHTHWIVDLLVKCETQKDTVKNYINDMIGMYDTIQPFNSIDERNGYELQYVNNQLQEKYGSLSKSGYYTLSVHSQHLLSYSLNVRNRQRGAFMFRNLLGLVKEYTEGKKDFYQVVGYSKRV